MINRRLMFVLPALSSGGHTEQLETASKGSSRLLLETADMRVESLWQALNARSVRLFQARADPQHLFRFPDPDSQRCGNPIWQAVLDADGERISEGIRHVQ